MPPTPILSIHKLTVMIDGVRLLQGMQLRMEAGQQITLTGPSGSGKSTLLRCILGFVPIADGEIYIQCQALSAGTVWKLRGALAYVAQEPDLGDASVMDAMQRPFSYSINKHLAFRPQEAEALMEAFLLPPNILFKKMGTLSGGEKQRVALMGALLLKRPLLLLDETASALDGKAKKAVRDYLCARTDLTILSVSHDTREFALSGAILDLGRLKGNDAS